MTEKIETREMRMIPIDLIDVLNPRERNKNVFDEIVGNIKAIGLKKPISVTPRAGPDGIERYLLICGEGRMKAFRSTLHWPSSVPVTTTRTFRRRFRMPMSPASFAANN